MWTGVASLDELLGGGLSRGDNVVWIDAGSGRLDAFVDAFLSHDGTDGGLRRHVDLSSPISPDRLEAMLLGTEVEAGARLAVTGLDQLLVEWGSEQALRFYTHTCPRLFDRGAVAYWTGTREVLGSAFVDGVTRVAQCVFELRSDRLRIVKAEGRPARLQGSIVEIDHGEDGPVVRREHPGGRVAEGLRRIRRERGLTQTQIARLAGVTPAAISQVESGRRSLSLDSIVPLCEGLDVSVDELLGTRVRADPSIARHDRHPVDGRATALFDDSSPAPPTHLVRLAADESGRPPFVHKGPEMVFVAAGLVLVDLGDTMPVLRAGDGLVSARAPIRGWTNLDPGEAMLLWQCLNAPAQGSS